MKFCVFPLLCLAACEAAPPPTVEPAKADVVAVEAKVPTKDEITAAFVGKTGDFLNGGTATWGTDGTYRFKYESPYANESSEGDYTIRDGSYCVKFKGGTNRCFPVTLKGSQFSVSTGPGKVWPVKFH